MVNTTRPRLSVSTWSLHRTIGDPRLYGPANGHCIPSETHGRGALSLLELPSHVSAAGIQTMEICHFHLPSLDKGYLAELRASLQVANVELFSLLIDEGDITDPIHASRDLAWIASWLDIANQLGAKRARVIAGKSAFSEETLELSAKCLLQLSARAESLGLRLMTENWYGLLSSSTAVHTLFERLAGKIGLCFDFGNWSGPDKYTSLRSIASYAESCHAKASFVSADTLNEADYVHCLEITRSANFSGPYTLIYDGPDPDEWSGLKRENQVVQPYL